MTRDEAMEIVYALRDWLDERDSRAYTDLALAERPSRLQRAQDKLVEALVAGTGDDDAWGGGP